MSHDTAITWLKTSSIALIVIGVYFAWGLASPFNAATLFFLDLVILPLDGAQTLAATETKLLTAIVGGLTAGIGASIYAITTRVYMRDPELGGALILAFALPWFVVDSVGSVLAGAWFNVAPNLVILTAIALPVALRRRVAA